MPENSVGLVGIGLSGSKLLLISSLLCTKNLLNLSGRESGEIFEGSIVFPRTSTVYNFIAKIIFLSLTDHV